MNIKPSGCICFSKQKIQINKEAALKLNTHICTQTVSSLIALRIQVLVLKQWSVISRAGGGRMRKGSISCLRSLSNCVAFHMYMYVYIVYAASFKTNH